MKINNKDVILEDYECDLLPYYFNEEQKKRAENGERIFVTAKKFFFEISKTEHKTIDYYETLMLEFLRNDDSKIKSLEGTELLYHFINYDWEGIGMSEVDEDGMFNITAYCDYNKNIVVVKTDVFEYGLAAALSIVKQIVNTEEENNDNK